jgi:DNA (cytosine-5)-methyltransferase 1
MIRPQLILDLNPELIVDNFAGGGGASTGIELALGRHVDHAINHDWAALGMHRINHPQTVHHCEDVFDIEPAEITEGRPVGMGWFSPDCKHFSKAKGGKPLSKKIRGLAFVMLRWAKIRTRVIYMENVEEIQTWGPLLADGRPDPEHKGRTWQAFLSALGSGLDPDHPDIPEMLEVLGDSVTRAEIERGFGYEIETREIRAFLHGAPTIRKRLYLIARCDGLPIVWPEPTHARPEEARKNGLKPWRTIAECIDWSIPCHSIFLTREEARKFRCKRPLAKSSLRRIAKGMDRYVLKAKRPYLVSLTHQGGDRVESVDEPARTLTGAHRGEKGVVDCGVAPLLTEHANATHQRTFAADEPLRTQCGEVKGGHFALVSASISKFNTGSVGAEMDFPAPTVPAGSHSPETRGGAATPLALLSAGLARVAHGEVDKKGKKRGQGCHDIGEPLPTQMASPEFSMFSATLVRDFGESVGQSIAEPAPTVMPHGQGKSKLVAANVVKLRGTDVGHPAEEPLHTASAGGQHHGLSVAYLAQHNAGNATNPGHPANEPASTISGKGCQQQVVLGSAVKYYGNDKDGQRIDEPGHTVTTKERFGLCESTAVSMGLTPEQLAGALRVAAFLREYGVEFEGELATVTVDGIAYVIVDIGMRMLTPRELFRAQGFPDDYVIDRAWVVDPQTGNVKEVPLTKEQQIRMCGNSVCPPVARALIAANNPELAVWAKGEHKLSLAQ